MKNILKWVRPNISKLKPYASARDEFKGEANVFLDANENPFDRDGLNRYPDPLAIAVKEKLAILRGVPVEQIFLGNGSDEAIDVLMRIFCEPKKDAVLVLPPTYGMYQVSADINNVAVRAVCLTPDFQPDTEGVLEMADKNTKILFLCSPNNPSANSFEVAKMRYLIEKFEGIVVVDEAYIDFSASESAVQWLTAYPNLVVMQTFSKAWGLAGIRLGMAFASPEIIALMNKVKPPYNVNALTQQRALKSLEKPKKIQKEVAKIIEERQKMILKLQALPIVAHIYPSDANFILVKMAQNATDIYKKLLEKGIVVRNRATVTLCGDCLRITIGKPKENKALVLAFVEFGEKGIEKED